MRPGTSQNQIPKAGTSAIFPHVSAYAHGVIGAKATASQKTSHAMLNRFATKPSLFQDFRALPSKMILNTIMLSIKPTIARFVLREGHHEASINIASCHYQFLKLSVLGPLQDATAEEEGGRVSCIRKRVTLSRKYRTL